MGEIKYVQGDATVPSVKGVKLIAHVCNDLGGWGKGFVVAVSRRWPEPEAAYRAWHRERASNDFGLGAAQFVRVEPYVWVANMVGQRGTRSGSKGVPVRYEAIDAALRKVAVKAVELGASVHMPRIGCGLAGGKWSRVEPLIIGRLVEPGLAVTVYDRGESGS
ncbi:macro domain-containing protein [Streptomyces sp. SID13726]|uniref:macro domain-containing protein n=1 Tax=Streptomyces sp. SID13726 TaxID=2706058 RepID=UPI0013B75F13|nr:macro domain-containing protein [Streptomyces sp. SID13726]NEA99438.1 macro domain-containing protein [Streptomyces sp. SID13726]